jgi:hypothetical protein
MKREGGLKPPEPLTPLRQDVVYRQIELAFVDGLEGTLKRMSEIVKETFDQNKFKYATLTLDIRNPSIRRFSE